MPAKFNGTDITSATFNGDEVTEIKYNGVTVFALSTLSVDDFTPEEYTNSADNGTSTNKFDIPDGVTQLTIDVTGAGGAGAGQNTGNGLQAYANQTSTAHTAQFSNTYGNANDLQFFGPNQARAGDDGGDTIVKLYSSADVLLATYTGSGGAGGADTGPNDGQEGFVIVTHSFTATGEGDHQGEAGNSVLGAGTGGLSWDFVGSTYLTCGGSANNYATCEPTRLASAGTGVGSGGGAGGYQITDVRSGYGIKGFSLGGKRGSNSQMVVNLLSAGAGSGSYLTVEVGAGGAGGAGNLEAVASTESNGTLGQDIVYLAVSRPGAGGSDGGAKITVTGV